MHFDVFILFLDMYYIYEKDVTHFLGESCASILGLVPVQATVGIPRLAD